MFFPSFCQKQGRQQLCISNFFVSHVYQPPACATQNSKTFIISELEHSYLSWVSAESMLRKVRTVLHHLFFFITIYQSENKSFLKKYCLTPFSQVLSSFYSSVNHRWRRATWREVVMEAAAKPQHTGEACWPTNCKHGSQNDSGYADDVKIHPKSFWVISTPAVKMICLTIETLGLDLIQQTCSRSTSTISSTPPRHGDIWPRGGSDERRSALAFILSPGLHTDWEVTRWDSSIGPLPHQPIGGWRRPLPLTQHLSPLRTEHLSFLFVLSYYYYQGNFQLSSLTRRQRRRPGSQSGFHTTFLTGGGVGGQGEGEGGSHVRLGLSAVLF